MRKFAVSAIQPNGFRAIFIGPESCPESSRDEKLCRQIFEQVKSSPFNRDTKLEIIEDKK